MPNGPKLFISHAAVDKPLVDDFIKLLEGGIGVQAQDIFCSSQTGAIPAGTDFKAHIKNMLGDSTLVVAMVSENYYNSAFCMCELGGTWLTSKSFIPLVVPPVTFKQMKAVLNDLQALRIGQEEDLDTLRDQVIERLPVQAPHKTPRWTQRRDEFLGLVPEVLKKLGKSPTVPREELEKAKKENKEYKEALGDAAEKLRKMEALIAKLKATKDHKEVAKITLEDLPERDAFETLVKKARGALSKLESGTIEALIAAERGEDFRPGDRGWDDLERPLAKKQVELNDRENGVVPSYSKTIVREASDSLENLKKWLASGDRSTEFFEWYHSEHSKDEPDFKDRDFWERHLID